jgi:hypothetical protein
MSISAIFDVVRHIVTDEFADIVVDTDLELLPTGDPRRLRIWLIDSSFIDVFLSLSGRYSYHWQRTIDADNAIYRHDNAPHARWSHIATFPKHFHLGSEENVVASDLSSEPNAATRQFCAFVRSTLQDDMNAQ